MSQAEIVGSKPAYIVSSVEIEREVPDWLKYAYKNAEAIQRVRELHSPFIYEKDGQHITSNLCKGCEQCWGCGENGGSTYSDGSKCECETYPCKTIKALDGDTA